MLSLKAVAAFDMHYPHTHFPSFHSMLNFCEYVQPDIFVLGGDSLDCGAISHHTKGRPALRNRGQMKRDFVGFRKDVLKPLHEVLPEHCDKRYLVGNHEFWLEQLIEEQPELDGLLDLDDNLKLTKHGWQLIPQGQGTQLGKLEAIHGDTVTGGVNHPRKALENYCCNLLYGHFHTAASATKVLPHRQSDRWMSWSAPCMCELNPLYLKNRPTAWNTGFVYIDVHPDGNFNVFPIITMPDGRFSFGGRIYTAD